jgi:autotransporter-associated beta strand protein
MKSSFSRKIRRLSRRPGFVLPAALVLLGASQASAQILVGTLNGNGSITAGSQSITGQTLNGNRGGGYTVLGTSQLTVSDSTLSNFRSTGSSGSGGGAGLGGAIFVDSGATVTLNSVQILGNEARGGRGGVGTVGGTMNGISVGTAGAAGTAGITWPDNPQLLGNGNGNGLPGTNGTDAVAGTQGPGGTGGAGGAGQTGWSTNQGLEIAVAEAALTLASVTAASIALGVELAAASANPLTANIAAGLTAQIAQLTIDIGNATLAQTNAGLALSAWNDARARGQVGIGGDGGTGGAGGTGSQFQGGGTGGAGGTGSAGGGSGPRAGFGGSGVLGGTGGFGAGGGSGGNGGTGSTVGGAGPGGIAGVGGGTGSNGTGSGAPGAAGGGGGAGLGGAIFVRDGGSLIVTGNSLFDRNVAVGGTSANGGAAGAGGGTDIFIMPMLAGGIGPTRTNVVFAPGAGNVVEIRGTIADTTGGVAGQGPLDGAGVTVRTGLTIFSGANAYSGVTRLESGTLRADDMAGLPEASNLQFAGGTSGAVIETSGLFNRFTGTENNRVQWVGSGGFAAFGGELTVELNHGGPVTWSADSFVPNGSVLRFGSPTADARVIFTNDIAVTGAETARFQVLDNGNPSADAVLSGVISGTGGVTIGGDGHNGLLRITGSNTYTGQTDIRTGARVNLEGLGGIANSSRVNIDGSLDISGTTSGASFVTLSRAGVLTLGDRRATITNGSTQFNGVIQGNGGVTVAGGTQTMSGTSTYTGSTVVNAGATLALVYTGSIAASSGVEANGIFTITGTSAGASIKTLSGSGSTVLGNQRLTFTDASTTFSGVISGAGGITVAGGAQALSGTNTYTGTTIINAGATLALLGTGSIATSSEVVANGTFDIAGTSAGASIITLSGVGAVALGDQRLTVTNGSTTFAGAIGGTGGVTVSGGTQTLTGTNGYTGSTFITGGATLALSGTGSIADSSSVRADGRLNIAATTAGASIQTLLGGGTVTLGDQTLTVTNGATSFSGVISGTGGLSVTGGTQTLSSANTYTGLTQIDSGARLALAGNGAIEDSVRVNVAGTFDISGNAGPSTSSIMRLSGGGGVTLGDNTLSLTNANDTFSGVISGAGGFEVAVGTQTLTAAQTYTGNTNVAPGATLVLTGSGAVATSALVTVGGTFDIAGTTNGTSVRTMDGAGSVLLGARRLTVTNGSSTFAGVMSGTGGLTVAGGAFGLSGVNTFTGETLVSTGATLSLSGAGAIATSAGVTNNGTFSIAGTTSGAAIRRLNGTGAVQLGAQTLEITAATGTYSGTIGGTGGLLISSGAQTLTGVNSLTGGIVVRNAALTVNADAALGGAGSRLTLDNSRLSTPNGLTSARPITLTRTGTIDTARQSVTLSGVISGTGSLTAAGSGVLTLSGTNTYSGGTRVIENTTLRIGSDAALGATTGKLVVESGTVVATANFDSARDIDVLAGGTFDSNDFNVKLTGNVRIDRPGVGFQQVFSGSAQVLGPLVVTENGTLVDTGATLMGVGTVNGAITVNGTVSPGTSPGTLTFTGPVTMLAGSTTILEIDGTGTGTGAGNFDRLVLTGAASVYTAGGSIQPVLRGITGSATNTFTPAVGTSFVVVQAAGGVAGTSTGIVQPSSGLLTGSRFDALYTSNAVTLYVTPSTYADLSAHRVALSANQSQVGLGLNALRQPPGQNAGQRVAADVTSALGTLFVQTPQALPPIMNRLSGTIYGDSLMTGLSSSRIYASAVADQAAARRGSLAAQRADSAAVTERVTLWMVGLGQSQHVGADHNTSYSASTAGVAAGADMRLNNVTDLGFSLGYTGSRVVSRDTGSKASLDMLHTAARGSWTLGSLWADATVGAALAETRARRELGVFRTRAQGSATGFGLNASAEIGTRFEVSGWDLLPSVALRIDELGRNSFTESGAGPLSLAMRSDDALSARGSIGIRASRGFAMNNGWTVTPSARLQYIHEFGDVDTMSNGTFVAAPSAQMRSSTATVGRDGAAIGLGVAVQTTTSLSLYANYNGEFRSNTDIHAATAGVRFNW